MDEGTRQVRSAATGIDVLALLEDEEIFEQEDLLSLNEFVKACKVRGLEVEEYELEFYEQQGLLNPILRIPRAKQWYNAQGYEIEESASGQDGSWYRYVSYPTYGANLSALRDEGRLASPNMEPFVPWSTFRDAGAHRQLTVDTYYVVYQASTVDYLKRCVATQSRARRNDDGEDEGRGSLVHPLTFDVSFRGKPPSAHIYSEASDYEQLVMFLVATQNRYWPGIVGVLRRGFRAKKYDEYVAAFSAEVVWRRIPIPLESLRAWRSQLCYRAKKIDPLVEWADLVGFMDGDKRRKLRGFALLAQDYYSIVEMITHFLQDMASQSGETEPEYSCLGDERYETQKYGRRINFWDYNVLERVLTDYGLNPRPKVIWVVEGDTEAAAIPIICEAMGMPLETFGIELLNVAGAGKPLDVLLRYAVWPRLGPPIKPSMYQATRLTQVFGLFDRENRWRRDEKVTKFIESWNQTLRGMLPADMTEDEQGYVASRSVIVERWNACFEYDNFTDEELADAISIYARKWDWPQVDADDVRDCRARFPKVSLTRIIQDKARRLRDQGQHVTSHRDYEWGKVEVGKYLAAVLAQRIQANNDGETGVTIVGFINRVVQLAMESWP